MNKEKSILVAEDDLSIRVALVDRLKQEGYKVLEAVDGQKTLDMAFLHRPDLILLDILMPVMDGMLVLRKIRCSSNWGTNVPVVLLTNLDDSENRQRAQKDKVKAYMVKANTNLDAIMKEIEKVFIEK